MKIEGLGPLTKHLRLLQKNCASEVSKVVKKNGAELQQEEMRVVPVDTGFLKRSITLTMKDMNLTAEVEPRTMYAGYVEYGTVKQTAQPYVRPSYRKQVSIFQEDMKKFVE